MYNYKKLKEEKKELGRQKPLITYSIIFVTIPAWVLVLLELFVVAVVCDIVVFFFSVHTWMMEGD